MVTLSTIDKQKKSLIWGRYLYLVWVFGENTIVSKPVFWLGKIRDCMKSYGIFHFMFAYWWCIFWFIQSVILIWHINKILNCKLFLLKVLNNFIWFRRASCKNYLPQSMKLNKTWMFYYSTSFCLLKLQTERTSVRCCNLFY